MDYVSDILAYNCATSAAGTLLPPTSDAIATQLKGGAAVVACRGPARLGRSAWGWIAAALLALNGSRLDALLGRASPHFLRLSRWRHA